MSRILARSLLALVVAAALVGVIVARRTPSSTVTAGATPATSAAADLPVLPGSASPITVSQWLNSEPLGPEQLAGKVVLYDFWTFGCSNCRATLPYLKAWDERYRRDGLVIVGVHTPEFAYEKEPAAVADYATKKGLAYPIALDPDRATWRAFSVHAWPTLFIHDQQGARRFAHVGEGSYPETEDAIRSLLGVDPTAPRAAVP